MSSPPCSVAPAMAIYKTVWICFGPSEVWVFGCEHVFCENSQSLIIVVTLQNICYCFYWKGK